MTQLTKITNYMQNALAADTTGHSADHIHRVVALANKILAHEPTANHFIVQAAAILHDVYDDKLFSTETDATHAKNELIAFLQTISVSPTDTNQILYIIDNMSWSKSIDSQAKLLDINGKIVQDADRLEAIGAIAITRAVTYGIVKHRVLYDPDILPRTAKSKAEYRSDNSTTINHFYEKLLLIKDRLNTDTARQIANSRHQFMLDFLEQFKSEWHLLK
ncbi:HD domain-containing protein [Leuconostoc miyukkimchii]|uniref:HD domain-containing protein n=1 Tax=Leuconostoc miyukkimchii TaxID=910540 RepID=UPI001C7D8E76|nr:HD domain-containing protein [Leuconostoc miyukkimchii]